MCMQQHEARNWPDRKKKDKTYPSTCEALLSLSSPELVIPCHPLSTSELPMGSNILASHVLFQLNPPAQ